MRGPARLRAALLLLLLLPVARSVAAQIDGPVRTTGGLVAPAPAADASLREFRGIPYAAPPVGDLRWREPRPAAAWAGVRTADRFAPACVQRLTRSRPPWTEEFMHQGEASEDCLYLNVWTAARSAEERRPVLVFLHGGGFTEGSGSVPIYDGGALARRGLVVVTLNYRLGALGFLAHPELTAESPHHASGDYGLLDQIAALRWVRENIAAFGGDPERVALAGQSAGAMSVYLLTASPLAAGLFQRAIVESGPGALASFGVASSRSLARPLAEAEADGLAFATAHGASGLRQLRALPAGEILADPKPGTRPLRFGPVIDGWVVPSAVADVYAAGRQNDVPLLTGMNADESSASPGYGTTTLAERAESARQRYADAAGEFLRLYPASTDREAGAAQVASRRDLGLGGLADLARERAATARTPAYVYYFERGIPWPEHPEFGAFHSGELPYVFGNLERMNRPWASADRRLAELVGSYWLHFAATGDPNAAGLPTWPAYDLHARLVMVLGEHPAARTLPDDAHLRFHEEASGPRP